MGSLFLFLGLVVLSVRLAGIGILLGIRCTRFSVLCRIEFCGLFVGLLLFGSSLGLLVFVRRLLVFLCLLGLKVRCLSIVGCFGVCSFCLLVCVPMG